MGVVPGVTMSGVSAGGYPATIGAAPPAVATVGGGGGPSAVGVVDGASGAQSIATIGGGGPYSAAAASPVNPAVTAVGSATAGLGLNVTVVEGAQSMGGMTGAPSSASAPAPASSMPVAGQQATPNGVIAGGPTVAPAGPSAMAQTMGALAAAGGAGTTPGVAVPVAGGGAIAVVGGGGGSSLSAASAGASAGVNAMGAPTGATGGAAGAVAGGGMAGCPHMGGAAGGKNPVQQTPSNDKKSKKKKKKKSGSGASSSPVSSAEVKKYVTGDVQGLKPDLLNKLAQLGKPMGGKGNVLSGFRARSEQEALYQKYLNGTGNLAAKPGTSNHEGGNAADAYINGKALRDDPKAAAIAKKLGLTFPVSSESWHVEVG